MTVVQVTAMRGTLHTRDNLFTVVSPDTGPPASTEALMLAAFSPAIADDDVMLCPCRKSAAMWLVLEATAERE